MMLSATQIKESWPSLVYSLKSRIIVLQSRAIFIAVDALGDGLL
jgi:hypothetical protein